MEQAYKVIAAYQHYVIPGLVGIASFFGGYASNGSVSHGEECRPEIRHVSELESQLASTERLCAEQVIQAQGSCAEVEEQACQQKIERFKTEYRNLRCAICMQGRVNNDVR